MVSTGEQRIWIEVYAKRKMLEQVIDQSHVIPGVYSLEPDLAIDENTVKRKCDTNIKGDSAEYYEDYTGGDCRGRGQLLTK